MCQGAPKAMTINIYLFTHEAPSLPPSPLSIAWAMASSLNAPCTECIECNRVCFISLLSPLSDCLVGWFMGVVTNKPRSWLDLFGLRAFYFRSPPLHSCPFYLA